MARKLDTIVAALVKERVEQGLSQREVARRVQTSPSNMCYWESGRHDPSLASLRAWAGALGFEVELRCLS